MNNLATSAKRLADLVERQAASGLITNDLIRAAGEVQFAVNSEAAKAEFKNVTPSPQTQTPALYQRRPVPDVNNIGWTVVAEEDIPHYQRQGQDIRALVVADPAPQMHVKPLTTRAVASHMMQLNEFDQRKVITGMGLDVPDAASMLDYQVALAAVKLAGEQGRLEEMDRDIRSALATEGK